MILLFELENHPLLPSINLTAGLMGQELVHVAKEEYQTPLKDILQGDRTMPDNPLSKAAPLAMPSAEGLMPSAKSLMPSADIQIEPMMIFTGMNPDQVSDFVDQLRIQSRGQSGAVLKAMLTPTNLHWSALYLCSHLREERAYHQQRRGL